MRESSGDTDGLALSRWVYIALLPSFQKGSTAKDNRFTIELLACKLALLGRGLLIRFHNSAGLVNPQFWKFFWTFIRLVAMQ